MGFKIAGPPYSYPLILGEWVRGIAKFEVSFEGTGLNDVSFCSPGKGLGACSDQFARQAIARPPRAAKIGAFFDTFALGARPSLGAARRFAYHRIVLEETFPTSPHSYPYVPYPRKKHSEPLLQVVQQPRLAAFGGTSGRVKKVPRFDFREF